MTEPELTEEQISDLKYFWEEKSDIERSSSFEKMRPSLEQHNPEVLKAWNDYKVSIKIMNAVIKSL